MIRKIAALVVFIAIAVMSISGTMAYFTADSIATNVITAGNIDIVLEEWEEAENGDWVEYQNGKEIMPGDTISKIVTVKNISTAEAAFIRVAVDKVIVLKSGQNDEDADKVITCNINEKDWTLKDGYYYYNYPLAAGEVTSPLFETVTFSGEMGNKYQNCNVEISVIAEAVQVKNQEVTTALEAAGWPTKGSADADQQ